MYLKALEIQGFKSFPDKTRLNFDQEITAIVGPNGSGKSNISDAILWVMGEQRTKTLRGGKMEDVIFGGTEKRSPMGFAQVSLILDNSTGIFDTENTEVMITRRYYRSGESEYYINREACRLRDINELLMDTGLGRDGYSIIGQGRIAEIVSGKSNERREIFEEAAGISRYRYRKEESERKLARTEENLLRINDKVDELELQVEPLRKQAETAKKYLRLRDELKSAEVSVWMETLDRLHAQAETVNRDYQTAKENLAGAQRELEQLYAASENIAQKMREKDLESERTREQISEAESAAAECESAAAVVRTNLQNSADSIARLRVEVSEQADRASALQAQIDAQQRRLQEMLDRDAAAEGMLGRDETGEGYIKLNYFNLFWVFFVCCVLGLILEDIWHMTVDDPGVYQNRAGMLFGPFSPIYGFGAVLMTMVLNRFYKKNPIIIFLVSALLGASFEVFVGWFMQTSFGVVSWNYSHMKLFGMPDPLAVLTGGRTCTGFACLWGLGGLIWIKLLLPRLLKLINMIPWKSRYSATVIFTIIMLVDGVMTLQSLDYWYQRVNGTEPDIPVAQFYGTYFDNEYMENRFQSMTMSPKDATRV